MASRLGLRSVALGYLTLLLGVPVGLVLYRTFEHGLAAPINSLTSADGAHAFWLTLEITAIAVPLNTIFGVATALLLARRNFPGRSFLNGLVDLPFAISPVVVGLALLLVYGRTGWFGGWLADNGIRVIFSTPGMVLATIFVSLPSSYARPSPCSRNWAPTKRKRPRRLAHPPGRPSGASRCRRSAGASPTASCSRSRAPSASSGR